MTAVSAAAAAAARAAADAPPAAGAAIRDTLDAVFRLPAFTRPLQETFWQWAGNAIGRLWRALRGPGVASPAAFWTAAVVVAVLVAYVATRAVQRREARARAGGARPARAGADPRQAADAAAARGDYAAAAHHLYAAVVEALARGGLVRPHPAKTAGDYARELRRPARPARGGRAGDGRDAAAAARAAAAGPYAAFARGYEAVVFGPRAPDRARYDALRAAAAPLLGPPRAGDAPGAPAPRAA